MNETGMLKPALIGGVLLGILSVIPGINLVNCFCCAWVIGGGIVASYLYVKASPEVVTLGRGVGLGLLTGAIGAVVYTIFSIPLNFVMAKLGANAIDSIRKMMENMSDLPPEAREALNRIFSDTASASLLRVILAGLFNLVIYPIASMIGGAIGVALFEKRKTGGVPPPPESSLPPPLPPLPPPSEPPPPPIG
jgi:hypothetical protein